MESYESKQGEEVIHTELSGRGSQSLGEVEWRRTSKHGGLSAQDVKAKWR